MGGISVGNSRNTTQKKATINWLMVTGDSNSGS